MGDFSMPVFLENDFEKKFSPAFLIQLLGIFIFSAQCQNETTASDVHSMQMQGMLGNYSMSREGSGTSWQPDSSPHGGIHLMHEDWMLMMHGSAYLIYDDQGGRRGDEKFISTNMFMAMAQRPLGPGTLGLRSMLTLEPATVGKKGYPLLLQTGETSDGQTPLIDRQHPHDFFMELAASYSLPIAENHSMFAYFGYPGEPALGPATFMHRLSGMDDPEAPITHHWLDSTHVTFGVATLGYIWRNWKLDGSIFTGREPDEERWDFEDAKFDSYSARLTCNFSPDWSAQVSYGWIKSPEKLEPEIDQDRLTASISYNKAWKENNWQTTLAWGRDMNDPGLDLDAFLLESALHFRHSHTFFGRFENVEKDELFEEGTPEHGKVFNVSKLSAGYIYDFTEICNIQLGIGGLASFYFLPGSLDESYSDTPVSFMVFVRARL